MGTPVPYGAHRAVSIVCSASAVDRHTVLRISAHARTRARAHARIHARTWTRRSVAAARSTRKAGPSRCRGGRRRSEAKARRGLFVCVVLVASSARWAGRRTRCRGASRAPQRATPRTSLRQACGEAGERIGPPPLSTRGKMHGAGRAWGFVLACIARRQIAARVGRRRAAPSGKARRDTMSRGVACRGKQTDGTT